MRTLAQLQLKQSDEARERVEGAFDMSGLGEAEGTAGDAASQEEDAGEDQDEPEEAPGGSGAASHAARSAALPRGNLSCISVTVNRSVHCFPAIQPPVSNRFSPSSNTFGNTVSIYNQMFGTD